jgi:hypothetical protein
METIMARFINDINHDISHIMEFHHYIELEEMVQYGHKDRETT